MAMLPDIDPYCGTPGAFPERPTCCTPVGDLAEEILAMVWGRMEAVCPLPADCEDVTRYVSVGPPESWVCNSLVVWIDRVGLKANQNTGGINCGSVFEVTFRFRLTLGYYPTLIQSGDDIYEPNKSVENELSWYAYQRATNFYNALIAVTSDGTLQKQSQPVGDLIPRAPQGNCVSFETSVVVTL